MKRKSDDIIEITIPVEDRWEYRVEPEHTRAQWMELQERYNWRCAYCGIRREDTFEGYLTRDHVHAVFWGGDDKIENIVPACKRCNYAKGWRYPGDIHPETGTRIPLPKPRKREWRWI